MEKGKGNIREKYKEEEKRERKVKKREKEEKEMEANERLKTGENGGMEGSNCRRGRAVVGR